MQVFSKENQKKKTRKIPHLFDKYVQIFYTVLYIVMINKRKAIFTTLGASSHTENERASKDFYATEPRCARELIGVYPSIRNIWECACGNGHLAEEFRALGLLGRTSDIEVREYPCEQVDFLLVDFLLEDGHWDGWIVTNPPYNQALEFAEKSIKLASEGVALFLKLTFLEGLSRYKFFQETPPTFVYVYSSRRACAPNGVFGEASSAACYAWFIWDKKILKQESVLREPAKQEPVIRWIKP